MSDREVVLHVKAKYKDTTRRFVLRHSVSLSELVGRLQEVFAREQLPPSFDVFALQGASSWVRICNPYVFGHFLHVFNQKQRVVTSSSNSDIADTSVLRLRIEGEVKQVVYCDAELRELAAAIGEDVSWVLRGVCCVFRKIKDGLTNARCYPAEIDQEREARKQLLRRGSGNEREMESENGEAWSRAKGRRSHSAVGGVKVQSLTSFVLHKLKSTDTLSSLALLYGIQKEDIKSVNTMLCDDLDFFEAPEIIIPNPRVIPHIEQEEHDADKEAKMRQFAIEIFSQAKKVNQDEAKYYLSSNNYDLKHAIAEFDADIKWERKNRHILETLLNKK